MFRFMNPTELSVALTHSRSSNLEHKQLFTRHSTGERVRHQMLKLSASAATHDVDVGLKKLDKWLAKDAIVHVTIQAGKDRSKAKQLEDELKERYKDKGGVYFRLS